MMEIHKDIYCSINCYREKSEAAQSMAYGVVGGFTGFQKYKTCQENFFIG